MAILRRAPSVYALLFAILAVTAVATWLIPAGEHARLSYDKGAATFLLKDGDRETRHPATQATLDALGVRTPLANFVDGSASRPVPVPGSYRRVDPSPAGPLSILTAPVAGMVGAADIIFFVLVIGGFIALFNRSGAFDAGLAVLAKRFEGREYWLIAIVMVLMATGGATFGMGEETLAFYPLLAPVFLAAGYDRMVPIAVIYGGSQVGIIGSMTNPFSTIIDAASTWLAGTPPSLFLIGAMLFFFGFGFFISSQSGMAVLTMPLLGPVAAAVGVGGSALVSAYLFGHSLMNLITPTGLLLPSLAMLGVGYGAWLKFIGPVIGMMILVCGTMLVLAA